MKKLFIIGLHQGVPETYFNMKTFLQEFGLNCITFCLSLDLKLSNILAGLGPHSSTYPCTWCEATVKSMQQNVQAANRTFGRIQQQAQMLKKALSEKRKVEPKHFFSCVEEPLLDRCDDELALNAIPPSPTSLDDRSGRKNLGCTPLKA